MSPRIDRPQKKRERQYRVPEVTEVSLPSGARRWTWFYLSGADVCVLFLASAVGLLSLYGLVSPEDAMKALDSSEGRPPTTKEYQWCFVGSCLFWGLAWINRRTSVHIDKENLKLSRGLIPNIWGFQRLTIPISTILQVATSRNLTPEGGGPDSIDSGVPLPPEYEDCRLLIQDGPEHYQRSIGTLPRRCWNPIITALPQTPLKGISALLKTDLAEIEDTRTGNRKASAFLLFIIVTLTLVFTGPICGTKADEEKTQLNDKAAKYSEKKRVESSNKAEFKLDSSPSTHPLGTRSLVARPFFDHISSSNSTYSHRYN